MRACGCAPAPARWCRGGDQVLCNPGSPRALAVQGGDDHALLGVGLAAADRLPSFRHAHPGKLARIALCLGTRHGCCTYSVNSRLLTLAVLREPPAMLEVRAFVRDQQADHARPQPRRRVQRPRPVRPQLLAPSLARPRVHLPRVGFADDGGQESRRLDRLRQRQMLDPRTSDPAAATPAGKPPGLAVGWPAIRSPNAGDKCRAPATTRSASFAGISPCGWRGATVADASFTSTRQRPPP